MSPPAPAGPRPVVAGTAGHVDHGKTELVRALTGTNPDRLKEEQERGITIDLGFAHLDLDGVPVAFVDVPGHERFVKNMLAGASGIDFVLLVIAADESIKPQTREHFDICRLLGVRAGLVALTKVDLADADLRELALSEVREFLAGSFLDGAPIVPVSARTGEGLDELKVALRERALACAPRCITGLARLPIDRAFSIRGFGTVVTGTLASGTLSPGDEVEILPAGLRGRVRGVQVHNGAVECAVAGQRTAVNLQGLSPEQVPRGQTLLTPGGLRASAMLDVEIQLLSDAPGPLMDQQRVRVHSGTSELLGRVRLLSGLEIQPGGSGFAQLRLESPAVAAPGDRLILRRYSPARTIAGARVLDAAPRKHRRADPAVTTALAGLAAADGPERVRLIIEGAGAGGVTIPELAARSGEGAGVIAGYLAGLGDAGRVRLLEGEPRRAVDAAALGRLEETALSILGEFHSREPLRPGLAREELRMRLLPAGDPAVYRALLETMQGCGTVRLDGMTVALAGHRLELQGEDARACERLDSALLAAGLDPPGRDDLVAGTGVSPGTSDRILHLMAREGRVVRLSDGRFVHCAALADLKARLYEFRSRRETIDIASFKDLAGVSRKNAIPLLEHFDAEKITVRRGNDRFIMPER